MKSTFLTCDTIGVRASKARRIREWCRSSPKNEMKTRVNRSHGCAIPTIERRHSMKPDINCRRNTIDQARGGARQRASEAENPGGSRESIG